jgi:hypothetical protein
VDFSSMSSREKAILGVLAVVIVIALIGIGLLAAKLLAGDDGDPAAGITPPPPTVLPDAVITQVVNPSLDKTAEPPSESLSREPVKVVEIKSSSPILPVVLFEQPLHPGRLYELQITAEKDAQVDIWGSWSQSARTAGGGLEIPLPVSIKDKTPYTLKLEPPVEDAVAWSLTVSISPQDLLNDPPHLVVTVWDIDVNP